MPQNSEMAENPRVRWTEHMPEDNSVRTYLIRVDDAQINRARKKLAKAGVTIIPHRDVVFPESPEPETGGDAARIAGSINEYLEREGLTPKLKADPGSRSDGLALEEITELWELAEMFEWEQTNVTTSSADHMNLPDWQDECEQRTLLILEH